MRVLQKLSALAVTAFLIFSCGSTEVKKTMRVDGYAQKGPFIIGSDIVIAELDDHLNPTGRTFMSTIVNDEGYFEIPSVTLVSNYVLIQAEGQYYNEVTGDVSLHKLTLYSLASVSVSNSININLITHLEKERVEFLVRQEGLNFYDAKTKALQEMQAVFSLEDFFISPPEMLDLSQNDVGGGILLSVSSIFSNLVNEFAQNEYADWLKLITDFKADFADNGIVDTKNIQDKLLSSASVLDTDRVKENMKNKYVKNPVPALDVYVNHFLEHSTYTNYFKNIFPENSGEIINILTLGDNAVLTSDNNYSVIISPPEGLDFHIGVTLSKVPGEDGSFDASSDLWSVQQSGSMYQMDLSQSNSAPINIPVSFEGTGQLNVSLHATVNGVVQPLKDFTLNW